MELDLPTHVSCRPSLEWNPAPGDVLWEPKLGGKAIPSGGYTVQWAGAIQGKEGSIQVLEGLAPSSQTVGSNKRVIHEQAKHSSQTTEVNCTLTLAAKLGEGGREVAPGRLLGQLQASQWVVAGPVDELSVDKLSSTSCHFLALSMSCLDQWVDEIPIDKLSPHLIYAPGSIA